MPRLLRPNGPLEGSLIVFDKDGVLLDFNRLWGLTTRLRAAALCARFEQPELAIQLATCLGLDADGRVDPAGLLAIGTRTQALQAAADFCMERIACGCSVAQAAAHAAFDEADQALDFASACQPLPGVAAVVRALIADGWLLALATTDLTQNAWRFLELAGIAGCFASVVGADRVKASKPDPAMLLLACQEAGVPAAAALVVGDTPADLLMAKAGGARAAIGVLCGVGSAADLGPLADWLVPDIRALSNLHG